MAARPRGPTSVGSSHIRTPTGSCRVLVSFAGGSLGLCYEPGPGVLTSGGSGGVSQVDREAAGRRSDLELGGSGGGVWNEDRDAGEHLGRLLQAEPI